MRHPRHRAARAGRAAAACALLLPALVLVGATGCATQPTAAAPVAVAEPEIPDARVREGAFRETFLLTGELRAADGHYVITPKSDAVPIRWMVDDGVWVEEGDRIAELDTTALVGQLDERELAVDSAWNELAQSRAEVAGQLADKEHQARKSELELRKAQIDAAIPEDIQPRREFQDRQLALHRARNTHEKALAELEAQRLASEAEVEVKRIALQKAERELLEIREQVDAMTLLAPASGIVVIANNHRENRKFQIGDNVWSGLKLAEIPNLERMEVEARLSDVDDGRIAPGMRVRATLDTYPDRELEGIVRAIGPVARESSWRSMRRHFPVRVELDCADPEIMRPGMSVRVEVETVSREGVGLVARDALRFDDAGIATNLGAAKLGPCNAFDCVVEHRDPTVARLEAP